MSYSSLGKPSCEHIHALNNSIIIIIYGGNFLLSQQLYSVGFIIELRNTIYIGQAMVLSSY